MGNQKENKGLSNLVDMVNEFFPISKESQIVFLNSIESWQNQINSSENYEADFFERVPVFIGRLLNKMEERGIKINSLSEPDGTSTFRHKFDFKEFMDSPFTQFLEEEITVAMHDEIIEKYDGKDLSIYTISPHVNKEERTLICYIRMSSI